MKRIQKIVIKKIPFFYIRHGQTDWNFENRVMGQTDIPLNSKGIKQANFAKKSLVGLGIKTICCSPLMRAKMTAEIINEQLNCELVVIDNLREFDVGSNSGKNLGQWFDNWKLGATISGAETYSNFLKRSLLGVNEALEYGEDILIVGHGGVYWTIELAIQNKLELDLPNCTLIHHTPPVDMGDKWLIKAG